MRHRRWVYWYAERFDAQYPDGRRAFNHRTLHRDDLAPGLTLSCRVDGTPEGLLGPRGLWADARLPIHPDAPNVPGPCSPRCWFQLYLGSGVNGRPKERHSGRDVDHNM